METVDVKLSTLGLCARAGKIVAGTQMVCDALKEKKLHLVISASGNSENTQKRISDRCTYYNIPLILCSATSEELGHALGKGPTAAVGITDISLARAVTGKQKQ